MPLSRFARCRRCRRSAPSFRICRSRRRSNSLPSRSCWADARCRTSRPSCMATTNPEPREDWSFARPARPGFRSSESRREERRPDQFKAALSVESSDPEALLTWLQGRGEIAYRSQKPLRLRGDVDRGARRLCHRRHEGRHRWRHGGRTGSGVAPAGRSRLAGRCGTEGGASRSRCRDWPLARSLAGPQGEWPDEARLSLDVGRAISGRTGAESAARQSWPTRRQSYRSSS